MGATLISTAAAEARPQTLASPHAMASMLASTPVKGMLEWTPFSPTHTSIRTNVNTPVNNTIQTPIFQPPFGPTHTNIHTNVNTPVNNTIQTPIVHPPFGPTSHTPVRTPVWMPQAPIGQPPLSRTNPEPSTPEQPQTRKPCNKTRSCKPVRRARSCQLKGRCNKRRIARRPSCTRQWKQRKQAKRSCLRNRCRQNRQQNRQQRAVQTAQSN